MKRRHFQQRQRENPVEITMAEDNSEFGVTVKLEESPDASPIEEDAETPQDSTNGVKT